MRKFVFFLIFFVAVSSLTAANKNGLGIGIILGEPTGLSAKKFIGSTQAIDAAAAWSFKDDAALHIHADYLFHDYSLIPVRVGQIGVYYGVGGRVKLADDPQVGVRIPVGLTYEFDSSPIDIFLEVVPLLDLVPETDFDFNGAIGIRFYVL